MQVRGQFAQVRLHVGAGGHHAAQITTEAKILALAAQHHGAYVRRCIDGKRGGKEIPPELHVDGVGSLGTRKSQKRNPIANVELYRFVAVIQRPPVVIIAAPHRGPKVR